ncbi:hypothetical protein PV08_00815 [Exophiala spinifera]|uniref:Uncharacterized protein n=1 Tax=Exophiala spinifera TaxID=91928 RepID=A0A0D2BNY1_9EURO|nr:uncharacterized protein PV08_00815 [Exophiala spinifera]KIW20240.1 hypothetical protein PV08_00815 [Exophiala spinifera]
MPRHYLVRSRTTRDSCSSASSASTCSQESDLSGRSSRTQYTSNTSYSYTKPTTKHSETCAEDVVVETTAVVEQNDNVDPRSSTETYASTIASERESDSLKGPCLLPLTRHLCYQPDAIACTPKEFAELFPSTRRILIQHDDTSPDGNLNLRADTEIPLSKGQKAKLTLFHLRMYDLGDRQFSLRRYQRQSGREVCSTKRKYLKPVAEPSTTFKRHPLTTALRKMSFRAQKPRPRPSPEVDEEGSDDDFELFAAQADIEATVPTDTIRIEFSNYAQVELDRSGRGDGKLYDFEYWGERYTWRKNVYQDGMESVFSFELVNLNTGACIAHITPDRLSSRQIRKEAAQGSWVPPCSMRILEKQISSDLGDVLIATGLMALTDDCIRKHWHEAHRP